MILHDVIMCVHVARARLCVYSNRSRSRKAAPCKCWDHTSTLKCCDITTCRFVHKAVCSWSHGVLSVCMLLKLFHTYIQMQMMPVWIRNSICFALPLHASPWDAFLSFSMWRSSLYADGAPVVFHNVTQRADNSPATRHLLHHRHRQPSEGWLLLSARVCTHHASVRDNMIDWVLVRI